MSKKDKKIQQPKKEPKKESQESILAKKIIDLEVAIANKEKEISAGNEKIEYLKNQLQLAANEYKDLISQVEAKANALIKEKIDENEKKFKANLEEAKKYAIEDKALDLIDIISKFSMAVNHKVDDPKIANWLQGFKMYLTMFNSLLKDWHVEQIVVDIGQEFDPAIMQCFETVKDESKPNNTVIEILEPGYKLYNHMLKPILVKVVKNN